MTLLPLLLIRGCSTTANTLPPRPITRSLPGDTLSFLLSTHMMRLQGGTWAGGANVNAAVHGSTGALGT